MIRIAELDALDLLARLPDDVPLTVSEAAIFLRVSKSALDKMRRPGATNPGPVYSQGGVTGAAGSNQKVVYIKSDLKAWLFANRCSDTLEAAKRKGQMFVTSLGLREPEAFWFDDGGRIAGVVEETTVDVFFDNLGKWQVEWISLIDALKYRWCDESQMAEYLWLVASKEPEVGSELTAQMMRERKCG